MPHILLSLCNMKNLRCLVRDMMHHVAEFNTSVHQPIDGIPTLVNQCTDNPAVNLPMGIIHTIPENLISVRKNKLLALYLAVHTKNASREKAVSAHRRIRFRNRYLCTHLCCCNSRRHAGRAAADNQNLCLQFHARTSCSHFISCTFIKNAPANSHLKALYKSPSLQYIFDTKYMIHAAFELVNYAEISNLVRLSIPKRYNNG